MCHGPEGQGRLAPGLRAGDYLSAHDDQALAQAIAYGTPNPKMPGFSDLMGGPLDANQIASLVRLLRAWGPAPAAPSAPDNSPSPARSRNGR
jgi:mono/diheme cytochrome c family protein